MTLRNQRRSRVLAGLAAFACATAGAVTVAAPAQADEAPADQEAAGAIPPHVFAPYYFSDSPQDDLYEVSQASGADYMTLAFLETLEPGGCTVYWNGRADSPVGPTYADGIAKIRAAGGDVFPSFGGARAGDEGTTLAESCHDVDAIAAEFIRVIEAYDFTRIDLDVEGPALSDPDAKASVDRRNKAIKIVQEWAAQHERTVEFIYTQPTFTDGLNDGSRYLLQNAVANDVMIDGFNIMTFDYYDDESFACRNGEGPPHDMAADTISAATALHGILQDYYPDLSDQEAWSMVGIIEMPGNSDFGECEAFTTGDAAKVLSWAIEKDIQLLSFWSVQRDGSGLLEAEPYQFSRTFAPFTHGQDADQVRVATTVEAGPLTMSAGDLSAVTLPGVTLTGQDQIVSAELGQVTVTDARGTGAGWSLTGQVSDLRSAQDYVIDAANLGWEPTASSSGSDLDLVSTRAAAQPGQEAATVVPGPVAEPGVGLATPQLLCSSQGQSGAGTYTCGATLNLGIPYDTHVGAYTGVLTLTLI